MPAPHEILKIHGFPKCCKRQISYLQTAHWRSCRTRIDQTGPFGNIDFTPARTRARSLFTCAGAVGFSRTEEPAGVHAEGLGAPQRAARGVHRTGTTTATTTATTATTATNTGWTKYKQNENDLSNSDERKELLVRSRSAGGYGRA